MHLFIKPTKSKTKTFVLLNIVQFLGALNDNIFKLLIVFLLIQLEGSYQSTIILSITGAVFVAPFLLFSLPSGILADRISKTLIIISTKVMEVFVMSVGLIMMAFQIKIGLYITLFFMAFQSAVFGPSKYGIIPELMPSSKLSKANASLNFLTFFAIILGTFLASFLLIVSKRNFTLAGLITLLIAFLGLVSSLYMMRTKAVGEKKKIHLFFFFDVYKSLVIAKKLPNLLFVILAASYFWFIGAFTQLNIIPYTIESLGLSDIYGGYLFLCIAFGIGLGSILAGYLSGKSIEISFSIFGGFGMAICFILLGQLSPSLYQVVIILVIIGLFGGIFIVPLDAYIQYISPEKDRCMLVSCANFLSFFGILIASLVLGLFRKSFNLNSSQGFLIIGITTIVFSLSIFFYLAKDLFRSLISLFIRAFYNIQTSEDFDFSKQQESIFLCRSTHLRYILLTISCFPNLTVLIEQDTQISKWKKLFFTLIGVLPVKRTFDFYKESKAQKEGIPICYFSEFLENNNLHEIFITVEPRSFRSKATMSIKSLPSITSI